jgi:hypothetical protein
MLSLIFEPLPKTPYVVCVLIGNYGILESDIGKICLHNGKIPMVGFPAYHTILGGTEVQRIDGVDGQQERG